MRMCVLQIGVLLVALAAPGAAALAEPCRVESFGDARYIVCTFDPKTDDMRIYWRGPDEQPLRTFGTLRDALHERGKRLVFAMNGGMYERDLSPVGLHVELGRTLARANTKTVEGRPGQIPNFYKKPNGVFYLGPEGASVRETGRFLEEKPRAQYATQSGPMLVIDGAIHPAFIVKSRDQKPRNGVGVSDDGKVHFVMTRGRVSFYAFARFFRDGLGTDNALFLDGGMAPGLYAPELRRNDLPSHGGYGPIIAVVE
jgi:uncharacterized protein YigE (DUF2233 family)